MVYCLSLPALMAGYLNKPIKNNYMKKFFISSFLVISGFLAANAQGSLGKSDPEGKKVLDAVSAKFKTYKTVTAKFSLKIENAAGKSLGVKTGTVYMKGLKYRISVTGQEMFSDGSNLWTYDKASNEVTITKLDAAGSSLTPQKLFTNFYEKDFLYKLNGPVKVGSKTLKEVELTPTDKTKPFHKVLLYVDNNAINSTKIFEKTGNRYTYSTTSLVPNGNVADAMFVFDAKKYPGVEVVDLR
jgi:outer membrane lipoprotein carrier protein